MAIALRTVLILGSALLIFMAFGFMTDPVGSGANFGLNVEGAHGLTSVRSDFTAFFSVSAGCLIWGAVARRRDPLIIAAALMLVTLTVRLLCLAIEGSFEGFIVPMVVEGILGITALIASRVLPQGKDRRQGLRQSAF